MFILEEPKSELPSEPMFILETGNAKPSQLPEQTCFVLESAPEKQPEKVLERKEEVIQPPIEAQPIVQHKK